MASSSVTRASGAGAAAVSRAEAASRGRTDVYRIRTPRLYPARGLASPPCRVGKQEEAPPRRPPSWRRSGASRVLDRTATGPAGGTPGLDDLGYALVTFSRPGPTFLQALRVST